jgi:transposase
MRTIKQSIGIDVAKDSLVCCIGDLIQDNQQTFSKTKSFTNDPEGFQQLLNWAALSKLEDRIFIMEATGVYYENLAYWLDGHNEKLSVLLPNKVKHFAKSLNLKTKTDNIDAQLLSRIGLERNLVHWKMPSKLMREIKFLSREYREAKA